MYGFLWNIQGNTREILYINSNKSRNPHGQRLRKYDFNIKHPTYAHALLDGNN